MGTCFSNSENHVDFPLLHQSTTAIGERMISLNSKNNKVTIKVDFDSESDIAVLYNTLLNIQFTYNHELEDFGDNKHKMVDSKHDIMFGLDINYENDINETMPQFMKDILNNKNDFLFLNRTNLNLYNSFLVRKV